jgi:hypothetical protein
MKTLRKETTAQIPLGKSGACRSDCGSASGAINWAPDQKLWKEVISRASRPLCWQWQASYSHWESGWEGVQKWSGKQHFYIHFRMDDCNDRAISTELKKTAINIHIDTFVKVSAFNQKFQPLPRTIIALCSIRRQE